MGKKRQEVERYPTLEYCYTAGRADHRGRRLTDDNSIPTLAQPSPDGKKDVCRLATAAMAGCCTSVKGVREPKRQRMGIESKKWCTLGQVRACGDEMCAWMVGSSMTSLEQKPCFLSDEIPILTANLNQGWITTVEILELAPEVVGNKHLFVLLDWCLLHVGRLGSWGLLSQSPSKLASAFNHCHHPSELIEP